MHALNYFSLIKNLKFQKDYPTDIIDSYFAEALPCLFSCLIILFLIKEFFFEPILCWIPHIWVKAYEDYTKSICFIENTYFMNFTSKSPNKEQELEQLKLKYYQWIPLFIFFLSFVLTVPRFLWKTFCGSAGVDIRYVIQIASMTCYQKEINKNRIPETLHLVIKQMNRNKQSEDERHNFQIQFLVKNKRIFPLIVFYIMNKILYLLIAIAEIVLLHRFLEMKHFYFPIEILRDYSNFKYWPETGKFPVITWCRVMIKENLDVYYRNIQCILPTNVVYEKICIGIWFLLVLGIVFMVINIFYWILDIMMPSRQKRFIRRQLMYSVDELKNPGLSKHIEIFIKDFLGIDGLFLLYILEQHVDSLTFQFLCEDLWTQWENENEIPV